MSDKEKVESRKEESEKKVEESRARREVKIGGGVKQDEGEGKTGKEVSKQTVYQPLKEAICDLPINRIITT